MNNFAEVPPQNGSGGVAYDKIPSIYDTAQPYLNSLHMNQSALMNIIDALCSSIHLLEGKVNVVGTSLGSRVDNLEAAMKNLAHNIQGKTEEVDVNAKTPPRVPSATIMPNIQGAQFQNSLQVLEHLRTGNNSTSDTSGVSTVIQPPPVLNASDRFAKLRPQALDIANANGIKEENLEAEAEEILMDEVMITPTKKEKQGDPYEIPEELKSPPRTPVTPGEFRWKKALKEVKLKRQASEQSILHSKVPSKLSIRERIIKTEDIVDDLMFEVEKWKRTVRDQMTYYSEKQSKDILALEQRISTNDEKILALETELKKTNSSLNNSNQEVYDEIQKMKADINLDITNLKEVQGNQLMKIDSNEVNISELDDKLENMKINVDEKFKEWEEEKLSGKFKSIAESCLVELLKDVEQTMMGLAFEEQDSILCKNLEILKAKLENSLRISVEGVEEPDQYVVDTIKELIISLQDVINNKDGKQDEKDRLLNLRLTEAENQLKELLKWHANTGMSIGELKQAIDNIGDKIDIMVKKVDHEDSIKKIYQKLDEKMAPTSPQGLSQDVLDGALKGYCKIEELDKIHDAVTDWIKKASSDIQDKILKEAVAQIDEKLKNIGDLNTGKGVDQELLDNITQLAAKVNKSILNYERLTAEMGNKAALDDVTTALDELNKKLRVVSLDIIGKDEIHAWLGEKADKKELVKLASLMNKPTGADYEETSSFIAARVRLQPVLRCLSCNHALPPLDKMKNKMNENFLQWQSIRMGNQEANERPKQEIIVKPGKEAYEMDPLVLTDGDIMSKYPRMMPPPNRVRTAAAGGGHGLNNRQQIRAEIKRPHTSGK